MDTHVILSELRSLLEASFPSIIEKIMLFGSQVTGATDEDSDFDILIITHSAIDWRMKDRIINACYAIDLKYDIVTDIKIMADSELRTIRGRQPYIVEAVAAGVTA
jgi:predicted nucleotidyltransferase